MLDLCRAERSVKYADAPVSRSGSDGDHGCFRHRLLGRSRGQEDARRRLGLGLDALNENTVEQRLDRGDRSNRKRGL